MLRMASRPMAMDRRWKTSAEIAPNCPRCASPNTKFCYYNNYSLSQPRYFCKGCRRYWTRGGSLRNVPVGGGCRKNRRSKSSTRNFSSTDRPSFNSYLSDGVTAINSTVLPPSSTTATTSTTSPTNNTGSATDVSNIDLGAVFAKFLNQTPVPSHNLGHNNQLDSPLSLTDSSSTSSSDLPQFPEQQVHQAQRQRQTQESRIDMIGCDDLGVDQDLSNFIGNYEEFGLEDHQASMIAAPYDAEFTDPNAYGRLQSMWMDDFSESQATSLWPGTAPETTVSANITWQTSQIQGLDSVVMTPSADDHHLTFHPNVLLNNEICSSFEYLSGYGITSSSCF